MPRLVNRLPSYRKHKPSGLAVVSFGGRDYYLGPYGSPASKSAYDRICGEYLAAGRMLPSDNRDELTVVELLDGFWTHAQQYYGPEGREAGSYKSLIGRVRKNYGDTLVSEFGPLRLKAFRQTLVDEKLSRTTINHATNRLRRIFKWGVENELVRPEILAALKCVAGLRFGKSGARETERVKPVPDALVDATLPHCSPQIAAMIQLQRITGMRSGEVCRMTTTDINTSGAVWSYTPARHKTLYRGHSRIVYLGPKAQSILRPWLRAKLSEPLFQPIEAEAWQREQRSIARKTPLSHGNRPGTNRKAKPRRKPSSSYNPQSYGRAITYAIQKANRELAKQQRPQIPHWHPHQLRHGAATLYRREQGLEVARVLLGHKHAAITEIYAEADQQRAVEAIGKIG